MVYPIPSIIHCKGILEVVSKDSCILTLTWYNSKKVLEIFKTRASIRNVYLLKYTFSECTLTEVIPIHF
jgi:hypothetical protein